MRILIAGPVSASDCGALASPLCHHTPGTQQDNYGSSVARLVLALHQAGHEVAVVTHRRGHGALTLTGDGFTFVQVPSRMRARDQALDRWKDERRAMVSAIRDVQPDVVHAQWTYEWGLAAVQSGLPMVTTAHDAPLSILRHHRDAYRAIRTAMAYQFRWAARRAPLSAPSPYLAHAWRRQMGWRNPIAVIPNIAPATSELRGTNFATNPTILEIADSTSLKNVATLLDAFKGVRARVPESRLRLIGPGLGDDGPFAARARALGLADAVTFLGPQSAAEVAAELHQAWVHAHASLEESFGMTLVEAMSAGVPVVAGRDTGATEWVLGGTGSLVDARQPDSWVSALVAEIQDTEDRRSRADAMLARVQEAFSPAAVAALAVRHYEDARPAQR